MPSKMTESEAKVILESEYKFHGECSVFGEALTIAINALEKQIPKKPKTDDRYVMYICPCCNDFIKVSHNCCQNCGQKLDWSDEE